MVETLIVGGGLVGSLLALLLARRGRRVVVHERREDLRLAGSAAGRSINLVVTSRGIHALDRAGLWADVRQLSVAVTGRMVHAADGSRAWQPYGRDASECNYSISRLELNRFLIDRAEAAGARLCFGSRLCAADLVRQRFVFEDLRGRREELEPPAAFGADGARSAVRAALREQGLCRESTEPLAHGYKELEIPPHPGGGFRIEGRALHIWPRGGSMLMALPNRDGSFTATLYLPHSGRESFATLRDAGDVEALFRERFSDAVPLIPELAADFSAHPTGSLGTVRCAPWSAGGRTLLVGDAAHAIVPFFGQGMNCGFEDCTELDALGAGTRRDGDELFAEFERRRKPNTDAIADMALDNFVEMRDRVGDPRFLLRKQVEHRLERELPREYRSRYSMVVYSLIPYAVAQRAGQIQQAILDELCANLASAGDLDLERARDLIRTRLSPYLRESGASLDY